jgi:hypothetical protein
MNKEIIIAKYNEDVSWVDKINKNTKITIYRKDGIPEPINNNNTILLENIGREIHSYIHHIFYNYETLSDYLIFSQGNPFDHFENIIDIVNGDVNNWNEHTSLYYDGFWGFHWNSIGTMWKMDASKQFNGHSLICQSNGSPQINPQEHNIDLDKMWHEIFNQSTPIEYEFVPGAHFIVTKELVYSRPKSFYNHLLSILKNDYFSPWVFERLIPYIFNNNFKTK